MNNDIKIEQYKVYVETADRVSSRRLQTNTFFISIISALLGVLAFIFKEPLLAQQGDKIFIFNLLGAFGILLNVVWFVSILAFKQLNSAKFKTIIEMEKHFPFHPFGREWTIFKKERVIFNKHFTTSRVEMLIPAIMTFPFIVFLIYANWL